MDVCICVEVSVSSIKQGAITVARYRREKETEHGSKAPSTGTANAILDLPLDGGDRSDLVMVSIYVWVSEV